MNNFIPEWDRPIAEWNWPRFIVLAFAYAVIGRAIDALVVSSPFVVLLK